MYKVYLKPNKEESLKRFHPWVFSGAIAHFDGEPEEGEVVESNTTKKEFIAKGTCSSFLVFNRVIAKVSRRFNR